MKFRNTSKKKDNKEIVAKAIEREKAKEERKERSNRSYYIMFPRDSVAKMMIPIAMAEVVLGSIYTGEEKAELAEYLELFEQCCEFYNIEDELVQIGADIIKAEINPMELVNDILIEDGSIERSNDFRQMYSGYIEYINDIAKDAIDMLGQLEDEKFNSFKEKLCTYESSIDLSEEETPSDAWSTGKGSIVEKQGKKYRVPIQKIDSYKEFAIMSSGAILIDINT